MYKSWTGAVGIGLLVIFSAYFLELGIDGVENLSASSIDATHEKALFNVKYNNFQLDSHPNPQTLPKTRYLLENYDENSFTDDMLSFLYYPETSDNKVKLNYSFFWDNFMNKRNLNKAGEYESYKNNDFEFLKFSNWKKSASKKITVENEILTEKKGCKMTNLKMVDGETGTFYSQKTVSSSVGCDLYAKERQCQDGIVSGDKKYKYTTCEVNVFDNCKVGEHKVLHGENAIFYKNSNALVNETCADLSQKRFCVNGKMTGDPDYKKTKCTSVRDTECFLLGKEINKNSIFYREPLVNYGEECDLQFRSCTEGKLSGRYEYEQCSVKLPNSCRVGLIPLEHDETKTFYKKLKVAFGDVCQSQERSCDEGVLSGNEEYKESFCAAEVPKSCQVGNIILAHGETKYFYDSSDLSVGEVCEKVERSCDNGIILGNKNYKHESCTPFKRQSCELDGVVIEDGAFVNFYKESSSDNCESSVRSCEDGVLTGKKDYDKSSCRKFETCRFGDHIIGHNAARVFYENHTLPKGGKCESELRYCSDGNLSGTFQNLYCSVWDVKKNEYCSFSDVSINNNESEIFYSQETVPYGEKCEDYSKEKFCLNGKIKGETKYVYSSCEVEEAPPEAIDLDCHVDGETIRNRMSKIYYKNKKVQYGTNCQPERRVCNEGVLNGSFENNSCMVELGETCFVSGKELKDGVSQVFYSKQKTKKGDMCQLHKQRRTCDNGVMSGDSIYFNSSCEEYEVQSCELNGFEVNNGDFARFYSTDKVLDENECKSQVRVCDDGELYGSDDYKYVSCTKKSDCKLWDGSVMVNSSRVFYKDHTVGWSTECKAKEIRTCDDGELSGSYTNQYCFATENDMCFYSGVSIREGTYKIFYSKNIVNEGEKCEKYSKKKFCLSGKVASDQAYIYTSCTEKK